METRIELYERYEKIGDYTKQWWMDNMPASSIYIPTYYYRRINPRLADIEMFVEIVGNKIEFMVRFYSGEEIVVKGNFDEYCIRLNDIENLNLDEDDLVL